MSLELKKRLLLSKWRGELEAWRDKGGDWYVDQLETALSDVRYWLHDGLVHHRLVSDPRALLRKIEEVL